MLVVLSQCYIYVLYNSSMTNTTSLRDKGVSIAVPEGYDHYQIRALANAMYLQFYRDHEGFCFRINRDKTLLTVFSVN